VNCDNVRTSEELGHSHVFKVILLVKTLNLRATANEYLHSESLCSLADQLADVSVADYSQSSTTNTLAVYKHALVPFTFLKQRVSFSSASVDRKDETHGQF